MREESEEKRKGRKEGSKKEIENCKRSVPLLSSERSEAVNISTRLHEEGRREDEDRKAGREAK